jgi:hypothetical protein
MIAAHRERPFVVNMTLDRASVSALAGCGAYSILSVAARIGKSEIALQTSL